MGAECVDEFTVYKKGWLATLHRNPVKNLILFSYLPTQSASTCPLGAIRRARGLVPGFMGGSAVRRSRPPPLRCPAARGMAGHARCPTMRLPIMADGALAQRLWRVLDAVD